METKTLNLLERCYRLDIGKNYPYPPHYLFIHSFDFDFQFGFFCFKLSVEFPMW